MPRLDFTLYLITDRKQCGGRNLAAAVEEALAGGVRAVQLREKDLSSQELYELADEMRILTARYRARLLINDRIDIALAVDADGVHLGNTSLPVLQARKVLGEKKLIGVSCHDHLSAISAQREGADFITYGPVYYTPSKAVYGEPVGVASMEDAARRLRIPVFALGGITRRNAREAIGAGAHGIALISAILAAADPRAEAAALLSLLPAGEQRED